MNASVVEGVKLPQIFPERCPALKPVQQDGEDTCLVHHALCLHSLASVFNIDLCSAPKALDAFAILWSMSGSILPDDAITDSRYGNSVTLSIRSSPTRIGALSSAVVHIWSHFGWWQVELHHLQTGNQ